MTCVIFAAAAFFLSLSVVKSTNLNVTVGINGTLTYDPPSVNAIIGDVLTFLFVSGNHTITQSSFENPCTELRNSSGGVVFDSGFIPIVGDAIGHLQLGYDYKVNTNESVYFYCRHPGHCEQGMVFAVNVDSANLSAFQHLAKEWNSTTDSFTSSAGANFKNRPGTTHMASAALLGSFIVILAHLCL